MFPVRRVAPPVRTSLFRVLVVIALAVMTAACGGVSDLIDDQIASQIEAESADDGSSGSDSDSSGSNGDSGTADPGDPSAFRLGPGGWENACTVLSTDDVAAATGFVVLEGREGNGCNWVIEGVDPDVIGEPIIGFQPMVSRQYDVQQEIAMTGYSGIVAEPIEGLGTQAYWQGNDVNALGEVWVQTDQIAFRITNQFAGGAYTDSRQPMEALAAAVAESLSTMDVIAASGDAGGALIPPDSVDIPEGIPTQDSLIDELSAVPLPDGTVIGFGDVYPDRASQDAYSELGVGDAARFFLEALPAAGFEITSNGSIVTEEDVLEFASQSISFLDPDGNRGDIQIREGAFSPSQLNIQIFLP